MVRLRGPQGDYGFNGFFQAQLGASQLRAEALAQTSNSVQLSPLVILGERLTQIL